MASTLVSFAFYTKRALELWTGFYRPDTTSMCLILRITGIPKGKNKQTEITFSPRPWGLHFFAPKISRAGSAHMGRSLREAASAPHFQTFSLVSCHSLEQKKGLLDNF